MVINGLYFSIKEGESRFIEHPPTIDNTYCHNAAHQFIPFHSNVIPKHAVRFDVDTDRSVYIGRLNGKDDQLCEIIFRGAELKEIKQIPCDGNGNNVNVNQQNEIEVRQFEYCRHHRQSHIFTDSCRERCRMVVLRNQSNKSRIYVQRSSPMG